MEANPVALDMSCQTQFQALTFLTMSVHAWPVSAFLPDYLVHPPSPGRIHAFQLCCHANPNFTSAPFWPVLPKEPVALYCKYSRHHALSLSYQQDHSPAQKSLIAWVCSPCCRALVYRHFRGAPDMLFSQKESGRLPCKAVLK